MLGATHAGGPRAVRPSPEVIAFFRRRSSLSAEDAASASVPFNYGPLCRRDHRGRIAEDIRRRLAHPFPAQAYRAQMVAAALHKRDASDSKVVDFLTAAPGVTVVDSTDLDFTHTVDAVLDVVRAGTGDQR